MAAGRTARGALARALAVALLAATLAPAEAAKHKFKEGDKIVLWANKGERREAPPARASPALAARAAP